jgi:hypothetical protein
MTKCNGVHVHTRRILLPGLATPFPDCLLAVNRGTRPVHTRRILLPGLATRSRIVRLVYRYRSRTHGRHQLKQTFEP